MMAPWQVWTITPDGQDPELVLIISSEFHLRVNVGRLATVVPVTDVHTDLDYRVPVDHDGDPRWIVTDQVNTITTTAMTPTGWTLSDDEISQVRRALTHMVAYQ